MRVVHRKQLLTSCGVVAICLAGVAGVTGSPRPLFAIGAAACAGIVAFMVQTRARTAQRDERIVVERLDGCALGPGLGVHAIRFEQRVLLIGATSTTITVLDMIEALPRHREPEHQAAPQTPSPAAGRLGASACLAVVFMLGASAASAAPSAQGESSRQRQSFDDAAPVAPEHGSPTVAPSIGGRDWRDTRPVTTPPPSPSSGTLVWLAALALVPFAAMTITSFVKVSVVLSLVRSAIGTPQIPSDPVLAAIALSLTAFVMSPVAAEVVRAVEASGADPATVGGAIVAVGSAAGPVRAFLQRNTRPDEIALFVEISSRKGAAAAPEDLSVLVPAFITSELRQAFIAGFLIFVPFLVVDLIVSNILMSMGMVMVSPATVALPFKVMLFVLVDGWPLLMRGLALSYH